jgi:hypothetical protein
VRDLLVPVDNVEVVGACYGCAEAERLAGVVEVVDVKFAL